MTRKAAQSTPNHLLRMARLERGWTQKDVADRIGAPLDLNVTRWERGTARPSAYYVQRLCELFGKSASELGLIPPQPEGTAAGTTNTTDTGSSRTETEPGHASKVLPTGTLTLLFIDLAESINLLQQLGDRYTSVLVDYRQIVRAALQQWQGYEVDVHDDAFFAVFARAIDAVEAAVAIQQALTAHDWPENVAVLARIGLHTGEPQLTAEGYVGLDVHHTARIMSAGHAGQILLSQTTHNLVEDALPGDWSLRDLGEHRLKDLQRPSHLFQLSAAGLPAGFPLLKTIDLHPNNLPVQPTPFMGREKEVATLCDLLRRPEIRLLTLTGPGGVGKTRLALQVAAEVSELFSDGVFVVHLAGVDDPEQVLPAIAQTLSIGEVGDQPLLTLVKSVLKHKQLLLLLDNFEQVSDAAFQVADLLSACPGLKILVTSQAVLHVRAEREFAVPPLDVPNPRRLPELVALAQYEAVALFIARAQAAKPDFQMTHANAAAIAGICTRLDGLPLALELAAARIKFFAPQMLLARLEQGISMLTGGARDLPARQQTMRGAIAWSYGLLSVKEQTLFRRLAVSVDGCTMDAAVQVSEAVGELADDLAETLLSLVDKSLLRQMEQEAGEESEPRFAMLQVLREFGLECLTNAGELEATRSAHAQYYLAQAEEAEPHLRGSEARQWFVQLEREHENLRAALTFLLEQAHSTSADDEVHANWAELALRLCAALYWFWSIRGYYREGLTFLERALTIRERVSTSVQLKVLYAAADLAFTMDDYRRAEELCQETLMLSQKLGDTTSKAAALFQLGFIAWARCKYAESRAQLEEALALFQQLGDTWNQARSLVYLTRVFAAQGEYERARIIGEQDLRLSRTLGNKGRIAIALGELARVRFLAQDDIAQTQEAEALAEQSLALFRELGDAQYIAYQLSLLGEIHLIQHEPDQARALLEESVATLKELGDRWSTAEALLAFARIAMSQEELATARAYYWESLALACEIGARNFIAAALEGIGAVAAAQGEPALAARLWGTAQALRAAIGAPLAPVYRAGYELALADARSRLGEEAFATAWAEGAAMPLEQALDLLSNSLTL
jgi:predicted ATPase/class 3 adenylate cyclase/DNA-binding XRE family transcriptional regulator